MVRHYSSTAGAMALQAGINSGATEVALDTVTGLPAVPFTLILDYGGTSEEIVTVTALVGTTATVTRGEDGTAAVSHLAGAAVRHGASARDLTDAQSHIDAESGVHGVTGDVVGTTDTQTLEGKTFTPASGSDTPLKVQAASGQTAAIQDWRDSGGTPRSSVSDKGVFTVAGLLVTKAVDALVSLIVKAGAAQSEALIEGRDNADAVVFRVAADGALTAASVTTGGALTAASVTTAGAIGGDSIVVDGDAEAGSVTVVSGRITEDGFYVPVEIAYAADTDNVTGLTTSETVTDTVTATLTSGRQYDIVYEASFASTVAGDTAQVYMREDSISGTSISLIRLSLPRSVDPWPARIVRRYTAVSTGSKTFVITAFRAAGTGSVTRYGALDRGPSRMQILEVG